MASRSAKPALGRPSAGMGYLGPIPETVWSVMDAVWTRPISVSSDPARLYACEFAFAASMGWVSNLAPDGLSFDRRWRVTPQGLYAMRHKGNLE